MSLIQQLISRFFKADTVARIRAESESWVVTCPNCQTETSVWAVGGIRYKAAARNSFTKARCPVCHERQMMPLSKRN